MDAVSNLIIGGLIGYFSAFANQWWKAGRDDTKAAVDELCKVYEQAAEAGAECWLTNAGDPRRKLLESRTLGLQSRMMGMYVYALKRLSPSQRKKPEDSTIELMRSLTGENFHVSGRDPNYEMAVRCQYCAANAMVATRSALLRRFTFLGSLKAFLRV